MGRIRQAVVGMQSPINSLAFADPPERVPAAHHECPPQAFVNDVGHPNTDEAKPMTKPVRAKAQYENNGQDTGG